MTTNPVDRALRKVVEESGMDISFYARATPDGRQLRIERTLGTRTEALHDLVVRGGTGLGGKAMVLRNPVAVDDYVNARTISHHYDQPVTLEGLRSIMAVPVVVAGRVHGVLYAALRRRLSIGDRAKHAAMTVVRETERLLARLAARRPASIIHSGLSEREYEVLCHVALGLGNAEIAHRMGLVPGTVKAYLRSVMRKLN